MRWPRTIAPDLIWGYNTSSKFVLCLVACPNYVFEILQTVTLKFCMVLFKYYLYILSPCVPKFSSVSLYLLPYPGKNFFKKNGKISNVYKNFEKLLKFKSTVALRRKLMSWQFVRRRPLTFLLNAITKKLIPWISWNFAGLLISVCWWSLLWGDLVRLASQWGMTSHIKSPEKRWSYTYWYLNTCKFAWNSLYFVFELSC